MRIFVILTVSTALGLRLDGKRTLLLSWHLCCSNLPKWHLFCPDGHSLKTPLSGCCRNPQLRPLRHCSRLSPDLATGWAELFPWLQGMLVCYFDHLAVLGLHTGRKLIMPIQCCSLPFKKKWVPKMLHPGVCCAGTIGGCSTLKRGALMTRDTFNANITIIKVKICNASSRETNIAFTIEVALILQLQHLLAF